MDEDRDYLTAGDVVTARHRFLQQYFFSGSGWFQDLEAAETLFDDLAQDGAFATEWIIQMGASE